MDKSTEARQRAFAEDQLDPSQMTPDQLRRKDARDRKRVERAREKQKKEVAAKMSEADRVLQGKYGDEFTIIKAGIQGAATNHKLWEENRRHLTQAQREAYEARESEVQDTTHWMKAHINGRYNPDPDCYLSLEEGTQDVLRDVEKHGLVCHNAITIPNIHRPEIAKQFHEGKYEKGASQIMLRYGYLVAIDTQTFIDFQRLVNPPKVFEIEYKRHICSDCGKVLFFSDNCGGSTNSLPVWKEPKVKVTLPERPCQQCDPRQDQRMKNRGVNKELTVEYTSHENILFDAFGRVKAQ